MVRHMGRDVVKFGHWDEYVATGKAWQEAATRVGLPVYRLAAAHRDPPGSISETHQAETARRDVASLAS
jgi:hypothetical protein